MKNSIVWLASYPKSGNTWTRIFLANYLSNAKEPVPINRSASSYGMGDSIAKDLPHGGRSAMIDTMNNISLTIGPETQGFAAASSPTMPTSIWSRPTTSDKSALGTARNYSRAKFTRSAIYIVRNPLDMVLSYARHYAMTKEAKLIEADLVIHDHVNKRLTSRPSRVSVPGQSWSDHVKSWTVLFTLSGAASCGMKICCQIPHDARSPRSWKILECL